MNAHADVADRATGYHARCWRGCGLAVGLAVLLLGLVNRGMAQQPPAPGAQGPFVRAPVAPAVQEANLRALTRTRIVREWRAGDPVRVIEDLKERLQPASRGAGQSRGAGEELPEPISAPAQRRTSVQGQSLATAGSTVAGVSFDGIPATGSLPPDTVGDISPNHYVQMVNTVFAIYDKEGSLLAGPSPINTLCSGFGGPCETENNGDPIVRYDHLADRWLLSQFALPGPDLHECIAISRTSDPVSGGWYLYDFPTVDANGNPVFPDYPKIGVWPDGYYMGTQRGFPTGGLDVWVFERDKMLIGAPAGVVQFSVPAPSLFLMPSDLDGPPPPAGTPNFFARQVDGERFGGGGRLPDAWEQPLGQLQLDGRGPAGRLYLLVYHRILRGDLCRRLADTRRQLQATDVRRRRKDA